MFRCHMSAMMTKSGFMCMALMLFWADTSGWQLVQEAAGARGSPAQYWSPTARPTSSISTIMKGNFMCPAARHVMPV